MLPVVVAEKDGRVDYAPFFLKNEAVWGHL